MQRPTNNQGHHLVPTQPNTGRAAPGEVSRPSYADTVRKETKMLQGYGSNSAGLNGSGESASNADIAERRSTITALSKLPASDSLSSLTPPPIPPATKVEPPASAANDPDREIHAKFMEQALDMVSNA